MAKLSREQAAKTMGMKLREVVDIQRVRGGHVVTTHDGVQSLIDDDGAFRGPYKRPPLAESAEVISEDEDAEGPPPVPEVGVPDGTAEQVLAWVGTSRERAAVALETEQAREQPRRVLAERLAKIAD